MLDHYSWVHPYDAKGRRCGFKDLPTRFESMEDDPYRSLAGEVRDAGGFAKSDTPFLEFLWANHFRAAFPAKDLKVDPTGVLTRALKLAAAKKSAHLPVGPESGRRSCTASQFWRLHRV